MLKLFLFITALFFIGYALQLLRAWIISIKIKWAAKKAAAGDKWMYKL